MPLCATPHCLFQVLGIAARVFGVDISPLSERMDEVTSFMGRQMLDFNDCVSGVLGPGEAAAKKFSTAASEIVSDDTSAHAMAQIEEFRNSPDSAAVSQSISPKVLEGDALDQLISAVQELGNAMRSPRQYINGLHCYTVMRPTAVLPDKVMWLCEHHRDLLQQWDASTITEEQLLERVEDPKAAAAASAAASSSPSPAPGHASAPFTPQPSASPSASALPGCFPTSFPPELKTLTAHTVASRIKAIGPVYGEYFQLFFDQAFDGKMISTFAGRSFSEVSHELESIGVGQKLHRDRVMNELSELFDAQTYPIQASVRGPFFTLRCTAAPYFLLLSALSFTHCHRRRVKFTLFFPATGKAAGTARAAALCCETVFRCAAFSPLLLLPHIVGCQIVALHF
jgi:hypothetical protein